MVFGSINDRSLNMLSIWKKIIKNIYMWEGDKNLMIYVFVIKCVFILFCVFLVFLLSLDRKNFVFVLCKLYFIINYGRFNKCKF